MIDIRDLVKVYNPGLLRREVRALDGLTLDVRRGEIFGFLGPNGAGKTTAIKVLLGFVRPTAGTARLLGAAPDDTAVRRRLGYLPEQPYFYHYLSGRELLDFFGELHGLARRERRARAERLLDEVGLADAAELPLRKYSKGMLQRLGLAQALLNDPELVVLDEPMSGLDPMGRKQVRDLILRLKRDGCTVFFSSHILPDVEMIADRVAIVSRGRVVGLGTLDDLLDTAHERIELCVTGVAPEAAAILARIASAQVDRGGRLLFTVESRERADVAVKAVVSSGGRVVSLASHRGTLEELFVERVGARAPSGEPR